MKLLSLHQRKQLEVIDKIEKQVNSNNTAFSLVSPVKDYHHDKRIALTSVHFPRANLISQIQNTIIKPLKKKFPNHYYYQSSSLHITIKNIRIINKPPSFSNKDVKKVQKVFDKVIPKHKQFKAYFYRLFLFPSNLSLFGTTDPELDQIVSDLNHELSKVGVPDDKTYINNKYFFCNITLARFNQPVNIDFRQKVKKLSENLKFAPYNIDSVSLIVTNASLSKYKKIKTWKLK